MCVLCQWEMFPAMGHSPKSLKTHFSVYTWRGSWLCGWSRLLVPGMRLGCLRRRMGMSLVADLCYSVAMRSGAKERPDDGSMCSLWHGQANRTGHSTEGEESPCWGQQHCRNALRAGAHAHVFGEEAPPRSSWPAQRDMSACSKIHKQASREIFFFRQYCIVVRSAFGINCSEFECLFRSLPAVTSRHIS